MERYNPLSFSTTLLLSMENNGDGTEYFRTWKLGCQFIVQTFIDGSSTKPARSNTERTAIQFMGALHFAGELLGDLEPRDERPFVRFARGSGHKRVPRPCPTHAAAEWLAVACRRVR